MPSAQTVLPQSLQAERKSCHLSQLELAQRLGVSQRHVSFVETGKAKPSRALLGQWLDALHLPLQRHNELMLQAGFAPLHSHAPLQHESHQMASAALQRLLAAHDPMPAFVLNAAWDVLALNQGAAWLVQMLAPQLAEHIAAALKAHQAGLSAAPNMVDALLHPAGLLCKLRNLPEVGPQLLAHVQADARHCEALKPRAEALAQFLASKLGKRRAEKDTHPAPVLVSRFAVPAGELAFFSMFTTFGSPQSITLEALRVEHLFAADAFTQSQVVQGVAHPTNRDAAPAR